MPDIGLQAEMLSRAVITSELWLWWDVMFYALQLLDKAKAKEI